MTKTSILFAHNVAKIGGAEKVTLEIISGLDKSKYACHLLTPEDGPLISAAKEEGAIASSFNAVQPCMKNVIKSIIFNRQLRQYLVKNSIGIIHTGDIFIARALIPVANAMNLHLVCHIHFPPDDGALAWVFKTTSKRLSCIYCSQELHDAVQPRLADLVPGAKHSVVHNGVDVDLFKKTENPKELLPKDKINIGIVANLQVRKGHKEFIESAADLVKKHNNLAFHIIGGDVFGEERLPLLKKIVSELNLEDSIYFHGQVSNVKDYLNELDIYVCSSYEEAFPISILEAMAFSLPIASTDVNGIPEAIESGTHGLLFPSIDAAAQTAAIEKLLGSSSLRLKLGDAARKRGVLEFSKAEFIGKIEAVYLEYA